MKNRLLALLVFATIAFISVRVAIFFQPDIWYLILQKPPLMIENQFFIPVWTVVYILIALSGWFFWNHAPKSKRLSALVWYSAQLVGNGLWFYLFFGLHRPGLAALDLIFMIFAITKTILYFWPVSRVAGLLLVPYLLWIIFAAYLTGMIWWLN